MPSGSQAAPQGFGQTAGPELTGRVCPYCRFPLKEGVAIEACTSCGAVHHIECWQDNGGCSVTGCVNGPSNTTATHVVPPATAPATAVATYPAPPPPPPSSKPPPPTSDRRFPTAAVIAGAVVVALLGAGAAIAISSSSKSHGANATVTYKEKIVEKTAQPSPQTNTHTPTPATHTAPPATAPPSETGPSTAEREGHAVEAVDNYWSDIENHDFSGAYQIEEPSAGSSESEWVHTEEQEGVEHVSYSFQPGGLEGNEATVNVGSLQTVASKTGCFTWTGYYRLTDYNGTWKITHDGLERHSC